MSSIFTEYSAFGWQHCKTGHSSESGSLNLPSFFQFVKVESFIVEICELNLHVTVLLENPKTGC
jgi:hypothetical protein